MQKNLHTRSIKKILFLVVVSVFSGFVIGFDTFLKRYALANFSETLNQDRFFLQFALHKNTGIIFNIAVPLWLVVFFSLIILATLIFYSYKFKKTLLTNIGIIMIVCGAVGNLIDRIFLDFVIDYIIIFQRSAINIADLWILTGLLLIFWQNNTETKIDNKQKMC